MFRNAQEEYPSGLIQLDYGFKALGWGHTYWKYDQIDKAVEFGLNKNIEGYNLYFGLNPRKPDINQKKSAEDKDIEIAFFQAADFDE